jgi:hypothetical protein
LDDRQCDKSRDAGANTPLAQRTLEAAQLAKKKFYTQHLQSLIKNHKSAKNLIENKEMASGGKSATNYQHVGTDCMQHQ